MLCIVPALGISQSATSTCLLLLITASVVPIGCGLIPEIESGNMAKLDSTDPEIVVYHKVKRRFIMRAGNCPDFLTRLVD